MTNKPPTSFWIISVLAFLWNLMGVYQFYLGNFDLESLRATVTTEEFSIMESMPGWYGIVFGVAVFTGVIGCLLLFARSKWATCLFGISLLTVLFIEMYWLFATDIISVSGPVSIVMPLIVIAIAIFLYFYSKGAKQKGWLS